MTMKLKMYTIKHNCALPFLVLFADTSLQRATPAGHGHHQPPTPIIPGASRRRFYRPPTPRRRSTASHLTEEKLEDHNRRFGPTSPYYRGLLARSPGSPGRESRVTSGSAKSSISTIFVRIHALGSTCFRGKPAVDAPVIDVVKEGRMFEDDEDGHSAAAGKQLRESVVKFSLAGEDHEVRSGSSEQQLRPKAVVVAAVPPPATAKVVKEREFVWSDRYRPKTLQEFKCNKDRAKYLHDLLSEGKCTHFIFEGPPGAGKRTMVWALLRKAFDDDILETREEAIIKFKLKGETIPYVEVKVKKSSHHVEINISDLRGYEKHIIQNLMKDNDGTPPDCELANCQAIVLYESDKLSSDAQHYIRWIMERSKSCGKIIFCCSDASKLAPLHSICDLIQLLPPTTSEIVEVLELIAESEGIDLPPEIAMRIAEKSKQNLRQAIRSFEASWQINSTFSENHTIMTGWEDDIAIIAQNIIDEQSPKQLYIIRGKLRKLIEHNVSPEFIFSTLVDELKKNIDEKFKPNIDALYLEYNRDAGILLDTKTSLVLVRSRPEEAVKRNSTDPGRKNLYHFMKIEEFTAKFMSFYKLCVTKDIAGSDGDDS